MLHLKKDAKNNVKKFKGGRKMDSKIEYKKNKGITLIALVVTIIVLLILARNKHKYVNRPEWHIK